ncbi:hypothetical protein MBLNU457_6613t1 [Dothideomycetes sp. NU457]
MHSTLLLSTLLASTAIAFPGMAGIAGKRRAYTPPGSPIERRAAASSTSSYPAWHPPTDGEVRSPCPGLNTLANHNICPRSGKGYTIPILTKCMAEGMNIGADFALIVGSAGIASNPNPLDLSFDLDMLDSHDHLIEHDASLSRQDAYFGNDHSFNQTIWDTVKAYYGSDGVASLTEAAKAKFMRVTTEDARDPEFSYGPVQFILSYGETALYLSVMGDATTGDAPVDYVNSLFEDERLPYEQGWVPPKEPVTLAVLGDLAVRLNVANNEEVPEGLIIGTHSLQAALLGLDPVSGQVVNSAAQVVGGLTGALKLLDSA